jgi:drug/metabolite transporter superfamily protein YnfA
MSGARFPVFAVFGRFVALFGRAFISFCLTYRTRIEKIEGERYLGKSSALFCSIRRALVL